MDNLEFENFEVTKPSEQDNQKQVDDVQISEEQAIEFSSSVVAALDQKAQEHNDNSTSKVKVSQLKTVYRRGAETKEKDKGLCAMARVNMFLRMRKDGKITYQSPKVEVQSELNELVFEAKAKIRVSTFVDITENWLPTDADFTQAAEDIKAFELNYNFKDINELYLDDYEKLEIIWG